MLIRVEQKKTKTALAHTFYMHSSTASKNYVPQSEESELANPPPPASGAGAGAAG